MTPSGQKSAFFQFDVAGQRYALPLDNVERVEPFASLLPLPDVSPSVLGYRRQ